MKIWNYLVIGVNIQALFVSYFIVLQTNDFYIVSRCYVAQRPVPRTADMPWLHLSGAQDFSGKNSATLQNTL